MLLRKGKMLGRQRLLALALEKRMLSREGLYAQALAAAAPADDGSRFPGGEEL